MKSKLKIVGLGLFGLLSMNAFAFLEESHLKSRLEEVALIEGTAVDTDALRREASYELAKLSLEKRAEIESQLVMLSVREAVIKNYKVALRELNDAKAAKSSVIELMKADLVRVDPALQESIKQVTEDTLENPESMSQKVELPSELLERFKQLSRDRMEFLALPVEPQEKIKAVEEQPGGNYSMGALLNSLANATADGVWLQGAQVSAKSGITRGNEETFSAQVSVEFMGSSISAGPVFEFKRSLSSFVQLQAEGLYSLYDANGVFDLVRRNSNGTAVVVGGVTQRRRASFTCQLELNLESEAALAGGFKVAGVGGEGKVYDKFTTTINFSSRTIYIPDAINNRLATLQMLANLCHNNFVNHKSASGLTVKENLNIMAKNTASGLRYVNVNMVCVLDGHCNNWFQTQIAWVWTLKTTPRCVQEPNTPHVMTCRVRGQQGANCTVYKDGKVVSSGSFEVECDRGFTCVVAEEGGWFTGWRLFKPYRGECRQ